MYKEGGIVARPAGRAAWRGWFVSLLIHLVAAGAIVYFLRTASPTSTPSIDTRWKGHDASITLMDEPIRTASVKAPATLPPVESIEIIPIPVSAKPRIVEPLPAVPPLPNPISRPASAPIGPSIAQVDHRAGPGSGTTLPGSGTRLPIEGKVKSIVFVLDRSASMGIDDRLAKARHEIMAFLNQLPAGTPFQIVVYNRTAETVSLGGRTGLVASSALTLSLAEAAMKNLEAEGGNDHFPAIRAALLLEPDVICLLTDADDLSLEQVRAVTAANRGRSRIHAVTLGSTPRMAMQQLAAWNRGACRRLTP